MKKTIGLIAALAGIAAIPFAAPAGHSGLRDVVKDEVSNKPVAENQAGRYLRHFRQRYYNARPQEPKNQQQRREHWRRCPQARPKKYRN